MEWGPIKYIYFTFDSIFIHLYKEGYVCLNCFEGICGNINKNTFIYVRGKDFFFSFLLLFTEMMCI